MSIYDMTRAFIHSFIYSFYWISMLLPSFYGNSIVYIRLIHECSRAKCVWTNEKKNIGRIILDDIKNNFHKWMKAKNTHFSSYDPLIARMTQRLRQRYQTRNNVVILYKYENEVKQWKIKQFVSSIKWEWRQIQLNEWKYFEIVSIVSEFHLFSKFLECSFILDNLKTVTAKSSRTIFFTTRCIGNINSLRQCT